MNTSYQKAKGSMEWYTPKYIIDALGPFDMDPCSPVVRPFDTAKIHYTTADNGLMQEWSGLVWCNPPYGKEMKHWVQKCADHGNAIVLIFARTETPVFKNIIFRRASAICFVDHRIRFIAQNCGRSSNAGAPSVLVSFGEEAKQRLMRSQLGPVLKIDNEICKRRGDAT